MTRWFKWSATAAAAIGILVQPLAVRAAELASAANRSAQIQDVELSASGSLLGVAVNHQGLASPGMNVQVRQSGQVVGEAVSGPDGAFAIAGLRGGIYEVAAGQSQGHCRVWMPGTAPPSARPSLLVVDPQPTVRGQSRSLGKSAAWRTAGAIALWGGLIWGVYAIVDSDNAS